MKTVIFLALLGLAAAEFIEIGYKVCKSDGTVSQVKADGCELTVKDGKKVCLFKKGSRPIIQIAFKPSKDTDKLKTSVRAKVGGSAMVDFPQTNSDACTYGVKCPVSAGENQIFEQSISITENHPAGEVIQVNWQLTRPDSGKELVHYTNSELELLDADCLTAVSFNEQLREQTEKGIEEEMGRRAKAKRRATKAAELNSAEANSEIRDEDETDCEMPSVKPNQSPSKIPVLQKGYQFSNEEKPSLILSGSSPSKIPRPKAQLVYLNVNNDIISDDPTSTYEPTSFTPTSGSFTHTSTSGENLHTMPNELQPLPLCDISSEYESKTEPDTGKHQVDVIAEANGMEMKLNMTGMLKGLNLNFVGLKFL